MHVTSPRPWITGLAAAFAVLALPHLVFADGQEVQFDTIDGVTLKGTFYPGGNGNKSSCVLLLHEFGKDRTKDGWDALAKELQKKGFAVLAFDFRGHNDSCTVDPMKFWNFPLNAGTFRPNKTRDTIDYKDIRTKKFTYLPWMTNDLAAAKRYLEQRNDANDCNLSNLFIVGAKEGAGLGAMWMSQEMSHRRLMVNPINPIGLPIIDPKHIHGEDLAGAVWLSMPDKIYNQSVSRFLQIPAIRDKLPMAFIYGSKDDVSARAADAILKDLKKSKQVPAATRELKVEGKASGGELLGKDGLETKITNYLNNVLEKRAEKPWSKRDSEKLPLELTK